MELKFYKLRVCDADLILVDDLEGDGRDRDWETVAAALLHRKRGAGAERLAVLAQAERDIWLRVFGPDGSEGEAGDAALCAARYLLDSGRSGADRVKMRLSGSAHQALTVDVLDSASLGIALGPPRQIAAGEGSTETLEPAAALSPSEAGRLATSIEASGGRYLVLPLCAGIRGTAGVVVFAEGGANPARTRIVAAANAPSPDTLSVHVVSRAELRLSRSSHARLDASAAGALALAAAAAVGYADREAVVRTRRDALWLEWTASGSLYAAARPEYVYRGEFHLVDRDER